MRFSFALAALVAVLSLPVAAQRRIPRDLSGVRGFNYMSAPTTAYTMGGGVNCKKYMCPEAFPVVFCQPGGGHAPQSWHPSAAWALFNAL